jgi:hypothetical protein
MIYSEGIDLSEIEVMLMDYTEWSTLKVGDRVGYFTYGKGTILTNIGVGYVVQFDNGKIIKIQDGRLKRLE